MRRLGVLVLVVLSCALAGRESSAATAPFRLVRIASVEAPVYVAQPSGDQRLFVVSQPGTIRVIKGGKLQTTPFLDLRSSVSYGGERGLLSVAFHPKFATNGKLYVDFTDNRGDTRIWELHAKPGASKVDPGHRQLLFIKQPYPNHNGGQLQFGPDGYLYIGMGDGGSGDDPHRNGQNVGVLLAKLLRIDVDHRTGSLPYAIPPDNPFRNRSGARAEIYAFGLRNPWRFSFDRATKDLYIGDVGQNVWEEVDALPPARARGANFGWNAYEGDVKYIGELNGDVGHLVRPVQVYKHGEGCSVTGGYVYRGSKIPSLRGVYLYSDYCQRHLWGFRLKGGKATGLVDWSDTLSGVGQVVSFGEDRSGELYLASLDGGVYKLVPR